MKKIIFIALLLTILLPEIAFSQSSVIVKPKKKREILIPPSYMDRYKPVEKKIGYNAGGAVVQPRQKQEFFRYNNRNKKKKTAVYNYNSKAVGGGYKSKEAIAREKTKAEEERLKRLKEWNKKIQAKAQKRYEKKKQEYLKQLEEKKKAEKYKIKSGMPKGYKPSSLYKTNSKSRTKTSSNATSYKLLPIENKNQYPRNYRKNRHY